MNLNEEIRGSLSNRYCVQVITTLHSKLIIFVSRILVRGDLGDVTVNALKEPPVNNSHSVGAVSGFKSRTCRKQIYTTILKF
jgi:hypothetical protein